MADLFDRLAALATGGPSLVGARPRARFEPRGDDREAGPLLEEEHVEVDGSPTGGAPSGASTAEVTDPSPSGRRADPLPGPAPAMTAGPRPGPEAPPAPEPVPVPRPLDPPGGHILPRPLDRGGDPHPVAPAAPPAPPPATEVRTIRERDRVHEVATVERVESSTSVVELIRWIDAEPPPAGDAPARASPPATSGIDEGRAATAGDQPPDPSPGPPGTAVAAGVVPAEPSSPGVTVSIDRLEVRTVPEPVPAPPVPPPPPGPVLEFAGPTLDEFLGGGP